ncbi:hypothetical protein BCON_0055g00010 [Botryotinia convoluta]|uniref:Pal1 cell morphology protein n=1 Tax=Botryotinia convoluta TaxID=54673 RepID=A0A4Z1IGX7_9HELO|nr:hypothetical protein BCON_0055g00010 [Botryotinia convoluta]
MPPHGSRESSKTRSLPRDGPSYGQRSANVSRNVSLERVSLVKEYGHSIDPSYRRPVSSSPSKSRYHSDSEGSQDGYGTDRSAESRGRSKGSKSGSGSDGTRSRTRNDLHSNSDSAKRSGRAQSQKPRSSSQASTRSKRAESPERIYLFKDDPYGGLAPEGHKVSLYDDDGYLTDHGQKARSKSRKKNSERDRSTKAHKAISAISVPFDGDKYLKGQLADPQAEAKSVTIEQTAHDVKGQAAQLDMCSDSEEELVNSQSHRSGSKPTANPNNRVQLRDTKVPSRGANSREHANQQPRYHGNENSKEPRREYSFDTIRKSADAKQTQGRPWEVIGERNSTRNQSSQANTKRGPVNEPPLKFGEFYKDWSGKQNRPASTQEGSVNEQQSNSDRYYANNKRNPSLASDTRRNHSQYSERYTSPDDFFDRVAGRPQEKKKEKSSLKKIGKVFGLGRKKQSDGDRV